MSTDLFLFGLSILTLVALIVLVVTRRDGSGQGEDERDSS